MKTLITDKLPDTTFADVLHVLTALVRQEFEFISREQGDEILEWLAGNRVMNQYYRITVDDSEDLWKELKMKESLIDFVMGITTKMRFYLAEDTWTKLIANSASAIGIHMQNDAEGSESAIMDEEYKARLVMPKEAKIRFDKDPWLMTCYLLNFLPASVFVVIRNSLDQRKKEFVKEMLGKETTVSMVSS